MRPIAGSIVALVTPMHDDGRVDHDALRRLIDWHIAEGTDCIGVVGTTGESPTVTVEEHCEVIRIAVEHAKGRVPIINPSFEEKVTIQYYYPNFNPDIIDALIDMPFALPTAVSGIALTAVFAKNGWIGGQLGMP